MALRQSHGKKHYLLSVIIRVNPWPFLRMLRSVYLLPELSALATSVCFPQIQAAIGAGFSLARRRRMPSAVRIRSSTDITSMRRISARRDAAADALGRGFAEDRARFIGFFSHGGANASTPCGRGAFGQTYRARSALSQAC